MAHVLGDPYHHVKNQDEASIPRLQLSPTTAVEAIWREKKQMEKLPLLLPRLLCFQEVFSIKGNNKCWQERRVQLVEV